MIAPTAHDTAAHMMHNCQGPSIACRAELYRSQDAQRAANEKATREAAQRSQAEAQAQALRRDMEFAQQDLQAGLRSAPAAMLQLAPLCGTCTQGGCKSCSEGPADVKLATWCPHGRRAARLLCHRGCAEGALTGSWAQK